MPAPVASPEQRARGFSGLLQGVFDRIAHLVREVGKFGAVGVVCYGIDVGIFAILNKSTGPYIATTISTIIATTVAFYGNRFWTWRDRERTALHREYLLYFGFNAVGLAIGVACLWVSHSWLGSIWPAVFATGLADVVSGKVIGVGLASLFRFWSYRRYVFPVASVPSEPR